MHNLQWLEPAEYAAWRRRIAAEHAGRHLTHARRAALLALVTCLSTNTEPTDANVAKMSCTSPRTVRRARQDARALGLLSWDRTRRVVAGRWRQGANAYVLALPTTPVCSGGQLGRARQERKDGKGPTMGAQAQIAAIGGVPLGFPTLAQIAARRMAGMWGRGI